MSMTGQQIYENFAGAPGPDALNGSRVELNKVMSEYHEIADQIVQLAGSMEEHWQGEAGGGARRAAGPLAVHHARAGEEMRFADGLIGDQIGEFDRTKGTVQPVPPAPEAPSGFRDVITLGAASSNYEDQVATSNRAAQANVDAMNRWAETSTRNGQMPSDYGTINPGEFAVTMDSGANAVGPVDQPGAGEPRSSGPAPDAGRPGPNAVPAPGGNGDPNAWPGGGENRPPARGDTAPSQTMPSQSAPSHSAPTPTPGPYPPGYQPPGTGQGGGGAQPGPPVGGYPPGRGPDGSAPYSRGGLPGRAGGLPGGANGNSGGAGGRVPGGGPGGTGGFRGGSFGPGAGTVANPGTGAGPGSGGNAGAGQGLGAGRGTGAGMPGGVPGQGPAAGAGAGRAGGAGGAPMGAAGGAGRGRGADEDEHQRKYVLDDDEAFQLTDEPGQKVIDPRTGMPTAPPVIGR
ncbi:hypothetical protein CFN78_10080 [Amycolatopsis antarctica]|uniref:PPE family domain-containing protein n=1 Tax=Amycolatopsis antarctica TaxID=1854586 RepID=A0A263D4U1_9PSEU|nr:hypothetical protein [Amycolatopsis antarctica]OZM73209.1 hypothetical protein CFN78_10080 [Amycolatopsis antarctica]